MRHWTDLARQKPNQRALILSDLACVLGHALEERDTGHGTLPELLELTPAQLTDLADCWFPCATLPDLDAPEPARSADQDAITLLLLWRGGQASAEAHWFAAIIARRAMETRHLWEDMGLPDRTALGGLIARHFPRLHAANSQNMRWKKFFYRQVCNDRDFALCLSPSCDDCAEKADCFAPEDAPDPASSA